MQTEDLVNGDELTPRHRMALAYAPRHARGPWAALLMLEQRLADAARAGRDPLMVQLRLAWWRDRLGEDAARWPVSEPVLSLLRTWRGEHRALIPLIDGWEALVIADDHGKTLDGARIEAFAILARLLGVSELEPVRAAAAQLNDPGAPSRPAKPLPRAMRPMAVLRIFAQREATGTKRRPLFYLARIVWAGLSGR